MTPTELITTLLLFARQLRAPSPYMIYGEHVVILPEKGAEQLANVLELADAELMLRGGEK